MKKLTSEELKTLIENNTAESVHVDFKEKWHENNAKLVHDILCLSNADHKGDRFLLLGVDNKVNVIGINAGDTNRKNSAGLYDLLRKDHFNRLPELDVYTLPINGKEIDVFHIANSPHKPYFLTKDKQEKIALQSGKEKTVTVKANIIYSRNGSSNTPIDSSANEVEIEKMWRERFGLLLSPKERILIYLKDTQNWSYNDSEAFYEPFPEFTIRENTTPSLELDFNHEWNRGEIGNIANSPRNCAIEMQICYHQTCLAKIHMVSFDGGKKSIVAPECEAVGTGRFYFYLSDSLDYAYHQHEVSRGCKDHSKNLRQKATGITFDIPVFNDKDELEEFLSFLNLNRTDEVETNETIQNKLFYEALEKFNEWKTTRLQMPA